MPARLLTLVVVLAAEALIISTALDTATLLHNGGVLSGWVSYAGPWVVRGALVFTALFATFGYLQYEAQVSQVLTTLGPAPLRPGLILTHAIFLAVFGGLSRLLFSARPSAVPPDALALGWMGAAAGASVSLVFGLLPLSHWRKLLHSTGKLWLLAAGGAVAACGSASLVWDWALWRPMSKWTFEPVRLFLSPFVAEVVMRPKDFEIGTRLFTVTISPQCSGLEGSGLLLVFTIAWLHVFRREVRFPRALILIPGAVVLLFLLNSVRIAALILIGNAGAAEIAEGGFHSQAGWIAFNSVAFGTALAARRSHWFAARSQAPGTAAAHPAESPATAAYLLPLLAILAAGMISHALSGTFEWLYWLRFPAALAALLIFHRAYAGPRWTPDWFAALAGCAVFLLWIGLDRLLSPAQPATSTTLAAAPSVTRFFWLAARAGGAILIVPVAEELAFRGYLLRRLVAADFEQVSFQNASALAILGSSLAFGLLHGRLWFAGILAGLAYAWTARRRGRLIDAIAAHATTNALLAAYVIGWQQWHLW